MKVQENKSVRLTYFLIYYTLFLSVFMEPHVKNRIFRINGKILLLCDLPIFKLSHPEFPNNSHWKNNSLSPAAPHFLQKSYTGIHLYGKCDFPVCVGHIHFSLDQFRQLFRHG